MSDEELTTGEKKTSLKSKIRIIIIILLVGFLLLFTFLNLEAIEVNLIFATVTIRRSLMIFAVFGIGFFAGWIAKASRKRK